ncbi:hypothetical protein T4D_3925 [Trichinella pseudospiralis]|uniref:Uncharacterized protein n=1 Tax=Trichinella pseudospiralis TaxID=6337 RepID=A0A0V1FS97_TRIPS|nr:hypothetical protein T4D_3925 [Trichinella pseudospiralis]
MHFDIFFTVICLKLYEGITIASTEQQQCLIVCFDINLTKIEGFLIIITTACIFVLFGENNFRFMLCFLKEVFEIRKFISVVM